MMKPIGHKDKVSNRYEISQSHSYDGTAARTRPFSYDEIMLRRKNKRLSGNIEDQRVHSEVVFVKGDESVSGRVEPDRHRHRHRHWDVVGGSEQEQYASNDPLKVSSQTKESKSKMREDKESDNFQRRSKIGSDNAKDRRKEKGMTGVHEKRKNQDRLNDGSDNEYGRRHGTVKDRDRNVNRRTQNGYDDQGRDQNAGKNLESRKRHDFDTSDRKQKEGLKSRIKRSRSREHERDKRRPSSPLKRVNKQRLYDVKEHEELPSLPSHSLKDRPGRFDANLDNKRVSNNGSSNKSKRHDTSASRLGGYSPRKRRSEAAIKTPSPSTDSPPVKMEAKITTTLTSFQPDLLSLNKIEPPNRHEVPIVVPPKPTFGVLSTIMMNASVDSVQLTQATRPKRRIYVENLPSSASEAAVVEWLTGYLRPYGINRIQGTNPCISCIVNKDKGQALVEFLTPEDASTALTFDGKSFLGNILKIRRPKDYVEATTGVSEKPVAGAVWVKNTVQDSPNKIFIGGISKIITSEMLMEIAGAFGPLKAYHFEPNSDFNSPCAFIEYVDQSVTIKACVGLNGMKLGGQILTVTQATPDTSSMENHGDQPFYGTPLHAQPLLQKQTQVLMLNNLVDPQSLSSLSELELEELLEDIRLECARFGMVKSVNIVKPTTGPTSSEKVNATSEGASMVDKLTAGDDVVAVIGGSNDEATGANGKDENFDRVMERRNLEENERKRGGDGSPEMGSGGGGVNEGFEAGCVLVEYKRREACAMAAHCLHGRIFDGRIVSVEYVAHDVYCATFLK